jgi:hypothetical protein
MLDFYSMKMSAPSPIPRLEAHPLMVIGKCLFNISAANFHIWRVLLHPQPKNLPHCGDKEPCNMVIALTPH